MCRTALMLAAERAMTAVCDYLLSRGADVTVLDHRGATTHDTFVVIPTKGITCLVYRTRPNTKLTRKKQKKTN